MMHAVQRNKMFDVCIARISLIICIELAVQNRQPMVYWLLERTLLILSPLCGLNSTKYLNRIAIKAIVLSFSSIHQVAPIFTTFDHPLGVTISHTKFAHDPLKNVAMHLHY